MKSRVLAGFPKGIGQINRQRADRHCWDEEICLKLPYSSNYGLTPQILSLSLLTWANTSLFLLLQNNKRFSIKTPGYLSECFLNVQVDCFFWCETRSSLWNAMHIVSFPVLCGQQKFNLFPIFQSAAESFLYLDIFSHISWESFLTQILCYPPLDINLSPTSLKSWFQMCLEGGIILHRQPHIWVRKTFGF